MTYSVDWDWVSAEKSFVRAIELNPNYATAHHWYASAHLIWRARFDEAIAQLERALELDPLSLAIYNSLGRAYYYARRYDLAIEQLRKTIEMDQNFYGAHNSLGLVYIFIGEISKGVAQLKQALRLDGDPKVFAALGYAYGISGNSEEAQKTLILLDELSATRVVSPYDFAMINAGLGDEEKAMELLQLCFEEREWRLAWLKADPFWDSLRDDPRFVELLTKLGLGK